MDKEGKWNSGRDRQKEKEEWNNGRDTVKKSERKKEKTFTAMLLVIVLNLGQVLISTHCFNDFSLVSYSEVI